MKLLRTENDWGIDIRVTFNDDLIFCHRVSASPAEFNEQHTRICPRVRVSTLSLQNNATPAEVVEYATELLQVAGVAQALQAEVDAAWAAEAVQS